MHGVGTARFPYKTAYLEQTWLERIACAQRTQICEPTRFTLVNMNFFSFEPTHQEFTAAVRVVRQYASGMSSDARDQSLVCRCWRKCCSALGTVFYIVWPVHRKATADWTDLAINFSSLLTIMFYLFLENSYFVSARGSLAHVFKLWRAPMFRATKEEVSWCVLCIIAKPVFHASVWVCTCTLHSYSAPRLQWTNLWSPWGFVITEFDSAVTANEIQKNHS